MPDLQGKWDCANPKCKRYHETSRHPYQDHAPPPKCSRCHKGLRLLRVLRSMDPEIKLMLKAVKADKS